MHGRDLPGGQVPNLPISLRQVGNLPRSTRYPQLTPDERTGLGVAELQLLQLVQHLIQPQTLDELHDVVGHAVLLADAEHRDDVRVVQLGRGFRLALEAPLGLGVDQHVLGQQLERDVTPKRDLLGLADNAHAALADFADDAKIPELL